jgi:hypothetical protein
MKGFQDMYNAGKFEDCGKCYAPDCEVTVNGGEANGGFGPFKTQAAVGEFLKNLSGPLGGTNMYFTVTDVTGNVHKDTWVADNGTGSCKAVWARVDGNWMITKEEITFVPSKPPSVSLSIFRETGGGLLGGGRGKGKGKPPPPPPPTARRTGSGARPPPLPSSAPAGDASALLGERVGSNCTVALPYCSSSLYRIRKHSRRLFRLKRPCGLTLGEISSGALLAEIRRSPAAQAHAKGVRAGFGRAVASEKSLPSTFTNLV